MDTPKTCILALLSTTLALRGAEKPVEAGQGDYTRLWFPSTNNVKQDPFVLLCFSRKRRFAV